MILHHVLHARSRRMMLLFLQMLSSLGASPCLKLVLTPPD